MVTKFTFRGIKCKNFNCFWNQNSRCYKNMFNSIQLFEIFLNSIYQSFLCFINYQLIKYQQKHYLRSVNVEFYPFTIKFNLKVLYYNIKNKLRLN